MHADAVSYVCRRLHADAPRKARPRRAVFPEASQEGWFCTHQRMMLSPKPVVPLVIHSLPLGPFETNAWVLLPARGSVTVVDPGMEPKALLDLLQELGRPVERILLTHGHLDHVAGCAALRRHWDCSIHLHPEDLFLYRSLVEHGAWYGFQLEAAPENTQPLAHGLRFAVGDEELEVLATPGHSPGSVCLRMESETGPALVCGDTLFAGAFGRTDLPGGSFRTLKASVLREIFTLSGATRLLPGHGPSTTVEVERRGNPLLMLDEGDEG